MTRCCELTGKLPMSGNRRSHALNQTKRKFNPNLSQVTLMSEALGRSFRLKISAHALKSVEHRGGLDAFLMKAKADNLSTRARRLKRAVSKAIASKAEAAPAAVESSEAAPAGS